MKLTTVWLCIQNDKIIIQLRFILGVLFREKFYLNISSIYTTVRKICNSEGNFANDSKFTRKSNAGWNMQLIKITKQSRMCGSNSALNTSTCHMYVKDVTFKDAYRDKGSSSRQYSSFKTQSAIQETFGLIQVLNLAVRMRQEKRQQLKRQQRTGSHNQNAWGQILFVKLQPAWSVIPQQCYVCETDGRKRTREAENPVIERPIWRHYGMTDTSFVWSVERPLVRWQKVGARRCPVVYPRLHKVFLYRRIALKLSHRRQQLQWAHQQPVAC